MSVDVRDVLSLRMESLLRYLQKHISLFRLSILFALTSFHNSQTVGYLRQSVAQTEHQYVCMYTE